MGVSPDTRLEPDAFRAEDSAQVYNAILSRAATALAAGYAVVADAVYARPVERFEIEGVAVDVGVTFTGLWLTAPADVLVERIEGRQGDASDANVAALARQRDYDVGKVTWNELDTSRGIDAVEKVANARLDTVPV